MKWASNEFGGVLLQCDSGNIAVNGGGTLADMEQAYLVDGKEPMTMIVTCEHHHRAHNVDRFCLKHGVPLLVSELCTGALNLEGVQTRIMKVPESRLFVPFGVGISLTPVWYDSVDPFYLIVNDGCDLLGIVPDGKIFPDLTKELLECDTIIPGNRLRLPERAPSTLERRLKSVYNTQEELDEIFKDYSGTLVYL